MYGSFLILATFATLHSLYSGLHDKKHNWIFNCENHTLLELLIWLFGVASLRLVDFYCKLVCFKQSHISAFINSLINFTIVLIYEEVGGPSDST